MGWFEGDRLRLIESPVEWPVNTTFVILKERNSKRFAILRNAGSFSERITATPVRTALRKR
jgi:hypothetical protein